MFKIIWFLLSLACILAWHTKETANLPGHEAVVRPHVKKPHLDLKRLEAAMYLAKSHSDSLTYIETKANIAILRKRLSTAYKEGTISMDSVQHVFTEHLLNELLPYWYDTPWSFEGHTSIPKSGYIACGYLISTTLKDMGLKLNRYKLAQKGPLEEATALSCGAEVKTITHTTANEAYAVIDAWSENGMYFIGFDKGHVGYLLKDAEGLFLIHSNYFFPATVQIEPLKDSRVFQSFTTFHLTGISTNEELLKKWLQGAPIF